MGERVQGNRMKVVTPARFDLLPSPAGGRGLGRAAQGEGGSQDL
jgi:hypothetical protein